MAKISLRFRLVACPFPAFRTTSLPGQSHSFRHAALIILRKRPIAPEGCASSWAVAPPATGSRCQEQVRDRRFRGPPCCFRILGTGKTSGIGLPTCCPAEQRSRNQTSRGTDAAGEERAPVANRRAGFQRFSTCPTKFVADRVGGASRPRPPTPPYLLAVYGGFFQECGNAQFTDASRLVAGGCREPRIASPNATSRFRLAPIAVAPLPRGGQRHCRPYNPSSLPVCFLASEDSALPPEMPQCSPATMASADFSSSLPPGCPCGSPMLWTKPEISRGKTCLLLPDPSDLPGWRCE